MGVSRHTPAHRFLWDGKFGLLKSEGVDVAKRGWSPGERGRHSIRIPPGVGKKRVTVSVGQQTMSRWSRTELVG